MDPVSRLLNTFRVARGIKVFRRLVVSVARSEVPDASSKLKARAQRIKQQKLKIERQKRHIEANNRQIEQLQKKLAETNSQLLRLSRRARRNGNSSEEVTKIAKIKGLYALGFTERALKDLQNLITDSSEPTLQSRAALQLSLWYADQYSEEGARQCLELLPVALQGENDEVLLRQAAIVEAECQEALGNIEAAKLAISRALEVRPYAYLFLARANLEASRSAQIEWVNKALDLHGISKISFDASAGHPLLDSLRSGQDKQERVEASSDTKVSVIVPVYNAQDT